MPTLLTCPEQAEGVVEGSLRPLRRCGEKEGLSERLENKNSLRQLSALGALCGEQ
jgi:hypothetical protein